MTFFRFLAAAFLHQGCFGNNNNKHFSGQLNWTRNANIYMPVKNIEPIFTPICVSVDGLLGQES